MLTGLTAWAEENVPVLQFYMYDGSVVRMELPGKTTMKVKKGLLTVGTTDVNLKNVKRYTITGKPRGHPRLGFPHGNGRNYHRKNVDPRHGVCRNSGAERTTADSLSFLENDFAMSSARINPDGTLFHTLMSKPGKLPFEVMTPTTNTTTNAERIREIEKPVPVRVPVEVERKMTWWERTCIKSAPWMFALLIAACVYIFRKPITNFAWRFIGSK